MSMQTNVGIEEPELFHIAVGAQATGYWAQVWRRFKKHRLAMVSCYFLLTLVVVVVVVPEILPYHFDQVSLQERFLPPSWHHPFGTDELGRDVFTRVLHGGRVSLAVGLSVALSSMLLGGLAGCATGYVGGAADNLMMRLVDIAQSLPRIAVLLVLSKVLGGGMFNLIMVLVLLEWTDVARLARGVVLSIKAQPYIDAARAGGISNSRILARHLLPNSMAPLIVSATLDAGRAIRSETTLSFLGLGIAPPLSSWGNLLTNASAYYFTAPLLVFIPGLFIFATLLSFNLMGDGLRDAMDPRFAGAD
jgi:ABC-type dipeptide/oligopeptide/nickel transport system permease subunit